MFSLVGGLSVSFSFLAPGLACLGLLSKVLLCSCSSICLVSLYRSCSNICLVSLCRSLPPSLPPSLFRGREARESRMPLLPLSLPTPPRAPACVSMKCIPPTTLESLGGVHLLRGSLLRRSFPAPLPSSVAGRLQRPFLGTFEPVVRSHLASAFILSLPSGASARPSGGL